MTAPGFYSSAPEFPKKFELLKQQSSEPSENSPKMPSLKPERTLQHQRSQFGPQSESTKRTSPGFSFGSESKLLKSDKVFISSAHLTHLPPIDTPGPGTYSSQSEVKSPSSPLSPMASLGGNEKRFFRQTMSENYYSRFPSPGDYDVISPQNAIKRAAPKAPFSTGGRLHVPAKGFEGEFYCQHSPGPKYLPQVSPSRSGKGFDRALRPLDPAVLTVEERRAASVPGPGAYRPEKVARSLDSCPSVRFAGSSRDQASMASMPESQRKIVLAGSIGPGPSASPQQLCHSHSKHRAALTTTFASGNRFRDFDTITPGPGTYVV